MAVEQAAAMSREEERLRKSFDSICTLLSTNNTALFISECSQFDQYVFTISSLVSLGCTVFGKTTSFKPNSWKFRNDTHRICQSRKYTIHFP